MKAILRQTRISSKKANLVAALVRGKMAEEAMDTLKFTPKKAAPIIRKLIASAVANAEENFKQKKETLQVKEIIVTEGPTYKRRNMVSKGRAHPIMKRTAHITIKLEAVQQAATKKVKAKAETTEMETVETEMPKAETKTVKEKEKVVKKEETKKSDK